jgi:dihydropyrimidinase
MYDFVIKNGTLITAGGSMRADLAVNGEKIVAIGQNLVGKKELDAGGKWVTPGAVDIHVHMEMGLGDGVVSADNFFTGTRAAAFGGTTTIIDFVETEPEQTLLEGLAARRAAADPQVVIDYGLHMTLGPAEIGKLDQVPAVYSAGCTSFKMYMAYGFRLTDDQMMKALEAVRDVGGFPVVHAENWDIICALVERNVARGNLSPHWHPRSRPAPLEGEAAGRVIDIAAFVGTPLHIFHVSCADVVKRIAAARRRGLPVTGETCPQYLFLTWDAYDKPGIDGTLPVCAPPLRPQADQDALWQALADGDLQIVTTDHCPFVKADKARGLHDFSQIPGGVPSIEMRFTSIYSGGVANGRLSPNAWVKLCCTTPAQLAGLKNKGDLAVGFDADIVIFDPRGTTKLSTETLHERVDWTPYEGINLEGAVETTIRRGEVIIDKGEFLGRAGDGRFINRALA